MWARVAFGDAQIGQEQRDRFGGHRCTPIGVDGQLVDSDVLLADRLTQQTFGQLGCFA
jgi:hypothetical protein